MMGAAHAYCFPRAPQCSPSLPCITMHSFSPQRCRPANGHQAGPRRHLVQARRDVHALELVRRLVGEDVPAQRQRRELRQQRQRAPHSAPHAAALPVARPQHQLHRAQARRAAHGGAEHVRRVHRRHEVPVLERAEPPVPYHQHQRAQARAPAAAPLSSARTLRSAHNKPRPSPPRHRRALLCREAHTLHAHVPSRYSYLASLPEARIIEHTFISGCPGWFLARELLTAIE